MRNLADQPGVETTDTDYINGKIVDGTTPIGEGINQDFIQLLQKLTNLASITPNGAPDNEYEGYQLLGALKHYIGSQSLLTKVVNIGAWDADTNSSVDVDHGLDWTKIREVNVMILDDAGANFKNIFSTTFTDQIGGSIELQENSIPGKIRLLRSDASWLNSSSYSGTGDRGYITIKYTN